MSTGQRRIWFIKVLKELSIMMASETECGGAFPREEH
jgi:hypothetical protein